MSGNNYPDHMKRVRKARVNLLSKHPFFGDLAFSVPIEFNDKIDPPTANTNGEKIVFHPNFVDELTQEELVFVLTHEVMHAALMHIGRVGPRCPKRWNYACDIVVNRLLNLYNIGTMPSFGVDEPNLYANGGGKVEKIYELLPESEEYGEPGSGNAGGKASMDVMGEPENDPSTVAANWRNKLQQAVQTAKRAGTMPGGIETMVDQLTIPKVPWEQHLRNFLMTSRGAERTWSKINRRYAASNITLPGVYGEQMGELAFLIDCSGSTSDAMVAQCSAEIKHIQEVLRPEKIHVIYFDTEVKRHETYGPDEPFEVKAYGRGGTCFRTSFEYMQHQGIHPESCVVATDLDCDDFGPKPNYPVLWCVMEAYGTPTAPWGQVIVAD